MDYEELDHYWREGYNAGYRRAVEFVKKSIEKEASMKFISPHPACTAWGDSL